jgi:hypothetical protein
MAWLPAAAKLVPIVGHRDFSPINLQPNPIVVT